MTRRIALWMKDAGELDEDQVEIVIYSLTWILLTVVASVGVLILGWVLGIMLPAAVCAASAGMLRLMSGGAHYSSVGRCAIMSSITFPLLALVAVALPVTYAVPLLAVAILLGLLACWRYAPVDNEAKPIRSSQRPFFRMASIVMLLLIGASVYFLSNDPVLHTSAAIAILWQILSLTPAGRVLYDRLDRMLGGEGVQA